jgi:hypothetical protein
MSVLMPPPLTASPQVAAVSAASQREDAVLEAVSILLGVGTTRLQADLSSGQSLEAIASSQHVSTNQLVGTIADALEASSSELTLTQANVVAAELAQRSGLALQVAAPVEPGPTESGSTSAPIRGVNQADGSGSSTTGRNLDMQL